MRTSTTMLFLCLLALLVLVPQRSPATTDAPQHRLVCRVFEVPLPGDAWDTTDPNHPIGAWVLQMADRGWAVHTTELAVGQKPTGYTQGYQQVCLRPS